MEINLHDNQVAGEVKYVLAAVRGEKSCRWDVMELALNRHDVAS